MTERTDAKPGGLTPSQTVGPFFHYCLTPKAYGYPEIIINDLVTEDAPGERIRIEGRVFDGDGQPISDAMIEIWQADGQGRYAVTPDGRPATNTRFKGFGRSECDAEGRYRFTTVKPGAYPWRNHPNAWRPAHIHFSLFGPSFTTRLITQMFFPGDPLFPLDPIFNSVPDPKARERLVAEFDIDLTEPEWALGYRFDIVLRGRAATPMVD